ncbi:MAG: class I SAM-dependent methyltransferase, partial [Nitrososphaerota archaeon]|nr:class I SAM-dependent methyltransferase [Nitrososphaerota archaeon]
MGCSTYTFLLSLDIKGRLYSIDVKKDVGQMVPSHLREKWRLFVGDSLVILPKLLDSLGEIDIFFHDSVHTEVHQLLEYSIAWKHLRSGGLLISDDVTEALPIFSRIVKSKATVFGNRLGVMRKQVC